MFIVEQIVVAIQKLKANQFPLNNLEMSLRYVFINEVTKELQFLYIPVEAERSCANVIEFIESIVYSVKPSDDKDTDFASRFIYYFRAIKPFDIDKIEDFVAKEDRSVVNTIKKQNTRQSGFMTDKPQHYFEHQEDKKANVEDEATGLLDEDDATGLLFNDNEETGILNGEDDATGLLNDDNDATGLLSENNVNIKYPTLYRVLTEESISVNKPVFRLGKERSYVDYFVTNNIAVSRSHADIVTRERRYFVKDLNSKNHTYINEKELPKHSEIEIHDGDRLKLGNEEFVFNT